jgi:hypothetical protein
MFVLLCLMNLCLRSVFAPLFGTNQPMAPVKWAQAAMQSIAFVQTHPLVPIHAPTLRHLV